MIAFAIASAALALVMYGIIKVLLLRHTMNKLPGPPTRWLTNLHQIGPEKPESMLALSNEYGGLFRAYVAPWLCWIWIGDCKHVKYFLKGSSPKGHEAYFSLKPWLGEGLLLANGSKWARSRRLLTPAFHFDILKPYMDVYNEASNTLVDIWSKRAASGEYFDIMPEVSRHTLDVIVRCAMSIESNCQLDSSNNPYVDAVTLVSFLTMDRSASPMHRFDFIYNWTSEGRQFYKALKLLHSKSEEVIRERRTALEGGGEAHGKYRDFLDILLTARDENGVGLTVKEIRDEVDTFMFEGHDTTAHGIGWTIYCLGQHPEIQQRCRQEIDDLLGDSDRDLTWADMDKLVYTHMCIREAMRIYPPVPVIGRELQEDMEVDGQIVPAGTTAVIMIYALHRNPSLYDNPMEYRPSRFSPEEMKKRDAFSYVPFSAGSRNCVGQVFASHEEKIAIAKVLRRFVIETDPDHELKLRFALVLRSTSGIKVRLREREH